MPVMTPNPALGVNARFAIGPAAPTTLPLDFEDSSLGADESFLDTQGLRGTRSHAANRVRVNSRRVTGAVTFPNPTALEWTYLLPYICGGAAVPTGGGNNFPLTEVLPAFYADELDGATVFRYSGCRIDRAVISAAKGTMLRCVASILGVDETRPGGAFPSLTLDESTNPFMFEDLVFTVAGDTLDVFSFELSILNFVQQRMVNSVTPTVAYTTDRQVQLSVVVPWGDDETLYNLAVGGVAVTAVFSNGGQSLSFTAPKFQVPRQPREKNGRDEMKNPLRGFCRNSAAANDELVVFADATP
jgi:hypothetical protein